MRPTATATRATFDPSGHVLVVRRAEHERHLAAAAWIRTGLTRREQVVVPEQAVTPALAAALAQADVDVEAALEAGRLVALPERVVLSYRRLPGLLTQALAAGHTGVRLCLPEPHDAGDDSAEPFERLLDQLCRTRPVSCLCPSPDAGEEALVEASALHGAGVDAERFRTCSYLDGRLHVAGEVDATNAASLRAVVRAATRRAFGGTLEVDVSKVTFLAAAGVHALVDGTREYRRTGGTVRVTGAAAQVAVVLEASGAGELLRTVGRTVR